MTLLRTKSVQVGTVLAFTGVSTEDGQTFIIGPPEFTLDRGDVVKVIDIDMGRSVDTPWAKVTVACLKGKFVGRIGTVSIDLSTRYQRSWQHLTPTGSMPAVRPSRTTPPRKPQTYSMVVDRGYEDAPTAPAPTIETKGSGVKDRSRCA